MQNKKYLLVARGSSHIRYFKKFAELSPLNVDVIKVNAKLFLPSHFSYLALAEKADIERLLTPHLLKKARKHRIHL